MILLLLVLLLPPLLLLLLLALLQLMNIYLYSTFLKLQVALQIVTDTEHKMVFNRDKTNKYTKQVNLNHHHSGRKERPGQNQGLGIKRRGRALREKTLLVGFWKQQERKKWQASEGRKFQANKSMYTPRMNRRLRRDCAFWIPATEELSNTRPITAGVIQHVTLSARTDPQPWSSLGKERGALRGSAVMNKGLGINRWASDWWRS